MKTSLISLILLLGFSAQADTAIEVLGWDSALPRAEHMVVSKIQTYAIENHYAEEREGTCGGDTAAFELTNYHTYESYKGELTHKVKIKFLVTGSFNYCEGEVVSECEVPMTLYSENHVSMGKPRCTVVELP